MPTPDPSRSAAPRPSPSPAVQVLGLSELDHPFPAQAQSAMDLKQANLASPSNPLHQIKAQLTVCVGTAGLTVGELLAMKDQQVLRLDQTLEHLVDVLLEGQVIARGVLVAVEDHFGVRITQVPLPLKP